MANPGTVSTTASACAPSYPQVGWNGSYLCVASPSIGSSFDLASGYSFCTYGGLAARKVGSTWSCVDPSAVVAGDVVSTQGNPSSAAATAVCAARGLGVEGASGLSTAAVQCKAGDVVAASVSDAKTLSKIDSVQSTLAAFAAANHTDLSAVSASSSGTQASVLTGDTSAVSEADIATYTPMVLLAAVLTCVLLVRSWDFAKRVVSA